MHRYFHSAWFLLPILLISCNEDRSVIGLELLKDSEMLNVGTIDTLTIEAYTVEPKHLYTTNQSISPLGSYTDPIFGNVRTEFISQFAYSSSINFGDSAAADSLVVELFFRGSYGNTEFVPKINVYELTSDLDDTLEYFSDFDPSGIYNPVNINITEAEVKSLNVDPENDDSLILKINLSNEYAKKLIDAGFEFEYDSLFYLEDSIFRDKIKGLYFETEQAGEEGSILYTEPVNVMSRIVLYYHNDEDTLEYYYYFYGSDMKINIYNFENHNGAQIPFLNDQSYQDTAVYIQSLGGTAVNIKIPDIQGLAETLGKVSINKAVLIIPVLTDSIEQEEYEIPSQLGLRSINEEDEESVLPDDPLVFRYLGYYGGLYEGETNTYRFNISNYLQDIFNGGEYNDLRLFAGYYNQSQYTVSYNIREANRVILASGNNARIKIRLEIFYTEIP
jgi:hypothetical protein